MLGGCTHHYTFVQSNSVRHEETNWLWVYGTATVAIARYCFGSMYILQMPFFFGFFLFTSISSSAACFYFSISLYQIIPKNGYDYYYDCSQCHHRRHRHRNIHHNNVVFVAYQKLYATVRFKNTVRFLVKKAIQETPNHNKANWQYFEYKFLYTYFGELTNPPPLVLPISCL